jgi:branched-chain amino acid transport system substrate-binding protein
VFNATTVVTGLAGIASYPLYGPAAGKIDFLSYYFSQAPHNPVNTWMVDYLKKNGAQANLFSPDGFVAAQMIVHAIQASPDDVPAMVSALEGWTFKAPKGQQTIRASDHAMLQPMYVAKLIRQEGKWVPKRVKTLPAEAVAPPAGAD